jgi:hypothetical protein
MPASRISQVLDRHEANLLTEWMRLQSGGTAKRSGKLSESQLRSESGNFLSALRDGTAKGNVTDVTRPEWGKARDVLSKLSRQRAAQGFTPSETAGFVLSFKEPLFERLRQELGADGKALGDEVWAATPSSTSPPGAPHRKIGSCPSVTTGWVSRATTTKGSSCLSSACTARNSREPVSGWPSAAASWRPTADESGWSRRPGEGSTFFFTLKPSYY